MATQCGPGRVLVVHQGEMGGGSCEKLPSKYDQYIEYIQGQATLNMQDVGEYDQAQLYTVLYGPLGENEYYEFKDLNNDGKREIYKATTDAEGNQQIITVYGRDDKFQTTETSYDDWLEQNQPEDEEDPALTELISQYGKDAVEDAQAKLEELQKVLGQAVEDPFGTLEGIIQKTASASKGSVCSTVGGGPAGTGLPDWVRQCVTVGVGLPIPFPLPGPLGSIFKGATVGEIEEAIKNAGYEIGKVLSGETSVEEVLDKIVDGVVGKVKDIFGDADEVSINSILGTIGDILVGGGYILAGDLYDEYFKDKVNSVIPNVPIIPFDSSQECQDSERYTLDADGNCGDCVDPNKIYDPYQKKCVSKDEDEEDDGVSLTEEEELCKRTGREYDELNDVCNEECENPDYIIKADGNCGLAEEEVDDGDDDDDTTVTPEEQDCENQGKVYSPDEKKCVDRKNKCPDPLREVDYLTGECKDKCTDGSLANDHVDGKCWQPEKTDVDDTGECPEGTVKCPEGTFNINDGSSCSSNPEVECKKRGDDTTPPVEPPPVDGYTCKGYPQTVEEEEACIEQGWAECGSSTQNPGRWYRSSVGEAKACGTTVTPPVQCNDPNAVNNGEDGPCECKPGY